MKLRKDIPNEGRNNILMFLFSIAFLMIAAKCTGQIKRGVTENGNVYKCVVSPIIFADNLKQEILLNISADSLPNGKYKIYLAAQLQQTKQPYNIKIGFTNGVTQLFKPFDYNAETGYSAFNVSNDAFEQLKNVKYDYICFETKEALYSCVNVKKSTYFIDFLNNYYK